MKKTKRILALAGAILLILMYVLTFIFAMIDHPMAGNLFRGSLACSMIIPVLLYGYILVYRLASKNDENKLDDKE